MSIRWRHALLMLVCAAVVGAKAAQLSLWPDPGGVALVPGLVRQLAIVAALVAALALLTDLRPAPPSPARTGSWLVAIIALAAVLGQAGSPPGLSLATLVVVTAIGEEVVFRGLLPALGRALDLSSRRSDHVAAATFGLWHLPDGWASGPLVAAGVVALTTTAALGVLVPMRRRCGTVLAPAFVHASANGIGLLATTW
ncbi:CPBP family intramembrane metalloprotease [Iamia majanohamensis]|uniref:CPBP family intramembrane metalloprotease n=1 Tax=Iamia majanohamensis TaxID=467976 RepID=A0AAE9Y903_9ACTN|nr:CPBP family intramembrane glutamic endopeptidase [Iamia majanohamensis]WCO66554.1 CPBP family intramembrane metalloprotease [Iamia majanohamensis]